MNLKKYRGVQLGRCNSYGVLQHKLSVRTSQALDVVVWHPGDEWELLARTK